MAIFVIYDVCFGGRTVAENNCKLSFKHHCVEMRNLIYDLASIWILIVMPRTLNFNINQKTLFTNLLVKLIEL